MELLLRRSNVSASGFREGGYGATAARVTPDHKVGSSNLSGLILYARGTPQSHPCQRQSVMCGEGKSRGHVRCHMRVATRSYKCPVCCGEGGNRTHARCHMKLARTHYTISVRTLSWKASGKRLLGGTFCRVNH